MEIIVENHEINQEGAYVVSLKVPLQPQHRCEQGRQHKQQGTTEVSLLLEHCERLIVKMLLQIVITQSVSEGEKQMNCLVVLPGVVAQCSTVHRL